MSLHKDSGFETRWNHYYFHPALSKTSIRRNCRARLPTEGNCQSKTLQK
ncbi:hypothetical protein L798_14603 [Zootermopsis nevadensis]|uniref:Uncharacterized protein n=1 Tax=Zootermopsis nevadensis TaxID=136037 RepID=A0A067R1V1_ZOONE|nr:hypothetical protein L798_14603 [Zootermopsis nevadensis]